MRLKLLILLLVNFKLIFSTETIMCYYSSANGYKSLKPEDIDPYLCTHINYAFISLQNNGTLTYANENLDKDLHLYERVASLKKINAKLKVLFSVGGVRANIFESVANNSVKRANLAKSASYFLKTYNFDGIDIDWEFPSNKTQKEDFITLLKDLRLELKKENWLLTAALSASPSLATSNVSELSSTLDYLNLMTYNYFGKWSIHTGQNSALYASHLDTPYEKSFLNVNASVINWIKEGAEFSKINIGTSFYGRQFKLADPQEHGLRANITGQGNRNAVTYAQICTEYQNWTTVWDGEQGNYYKYLEDQWLGYDEIRSIELKASYAVSNNLSGVMVWHIGQDDLSGKCGEKQSLLKTINNILNLANNKV